MVPNNLFTGQLWRHRHSGYTDGLGERGREGEIYGKRNMESTLPYVKSIANVNLLYGSGNSNRRSVST